MGYIGTRIATAIYRDTTMNKQLKWGLVSAVCVAILVVIFIVVNRANSRSDDEVLDELRQRINNELSAQNSLDESTYKMMVDSIDTWKQRGIINAKGVLALRTALAESMSGKVFALYNDVLARYNDNPDEARKKMTSYYDLVDEMSSDMDSLGVSSLGGKFADIQQLHSLYTEIWSAAKFGQRPAPDFDSKNLSWTSFDEMKARIVATVTGYHDNRWYPKVKHIEGFADAVDKESITAMVEGCRDDYYEELSKQIVDYFDKCKGNQTEGYGKVLKAFGAQTDTVSDVYTNLKRDYKIYYDSYKYR